MTAGILDNDALKGVLDYFFTLSRYPRRSGKEEAAIDYLESWARGAGFEVRRDEAGNLAIDCPSCAPQNAMSLSPIVLQAHIDMVCIASNPDVDLDRMTVSPYVEGGMLRASGTTLGADNGIGIAIAQYLAARPHRRPLRLVFTVDEEETMAGAQSLDPAWLDAAYLVNLDSSFADKLTVGAAGSREVVLEKSVASSRSTAGFQGFEVAIDGLAGGHSGDDVGKGRSNAVEAVLDVLDLLSSNDVFWELESLDVPGASNAIASSATLLGNVASFADLSQACAKTEAQLKSACPDDASVSVKCFERPVFDVCIEQGFSYMELLRALPEGIIEASQNPLTPALLSANTGRVDLALDGFRAECLIRFSRHEECESCFSEYVKAAQHFGADVQQAAQSAPWTERADSRLAAAYERSYKDVVGKAPVRMAIHSAVECGEFQLLNPDIDVISISPDVFDAHSVSERVGLASLRTIVEVLERLIDSDIESTGV